MTDSNSDSRQQGRQGEGGGGSRGGRNSGNREGGGFRIRLSDNEMRAVRALQEAFNLRSTVAVLGFAVRALAQMLEDGQLTELIAQQRAQGGGRRSEDGRGEGNRGERNRTPRPDPFARPAKPQPPAPDPEPAAEPEPAVEAEASPETEASTDASASDGTSTPASDDNTETGA
ncbi:MAG: hypothetical protein WBI13_01115 [Synechococcus sp.]|jgi:hypothetical protein|uniref:hypothetical protein n=1 Tax=Synechococcus sp. MVIR-18-1 TaxID=1386941 RepID=UPI001648A2D9|nr:hypothetical protein [Synechococcus sp. MVIR-18-1]MDB4683196.1 hypothetical protein [bacterium]MDC0261101.1 hypothetical protein [Synechococcus sp. AH-551-N17]QNI76979.1 hypothetical protein SynMVIR181_02011 [Synechococcus sp. MVIR-18-1]